MENWEEILRKREEANRPKAPVDKAAEREKKLISIRGEFIRAYYADYNVSGVLMGFAVEVWNKGAIQKIDDVYIHEISVRNLDWNGRPFFSGDAYRTESHEMMRYGYKLEATSDNKTHFISVTGEQRVGLFIPGRTKITNFNLQSGYHPEHSNSEKTILNSGTLRANQNDQFQRQDLVDLLAKDTIIRQQRGLMP